MATSGTIATTVISTDTVVDHALLRVGKQPAIQTPQIVQQALESLFMLLLSLSSRGLNLWAVEKYLQGLTPGQPTYDTPAGTLEILNVIYSQPTVDTVVGVVIVDGMSLTPTAAVQRVGALFGAPYTGVITVNGVAQPLATYNTTQPYWFDLRPPVSSYFEVRGSGASINALYGVTGLRDLPIEPMNRDSYMSLPNKAQQSHPCVNYWFEKKIPPRITLWPVPDNSNDHLTLMRHRQVQDVGSLSQQLELPAYWLEPITWQLALRLAFELPDIDPNRATLVTQMAGNYLIEGELGEDDGMPSVLMPKISQYTA
jgi:hypothetical protein